MYFTNTEALQELEREMKTVPGFDRYSSFDEKENLDFDSEVKEDE